MSFGFHGVTDKTEAF